MEWSPERTAEWLARIADRKEEFPLHYEDPKDGKLAPQLVIQEIDRITGHDAIICTDVGPAPDVGDAVLHVHPPAAVHQLGRPRHHGLRPAGQPSAPRSADPDKTVIDISGDGGFQMTMQELATAVSYDVPVVVCHPQQRLPRHGPPVAGPVLEQALLVHLHRRERLRRVPPGAPAACAAGAGRSRTSSCSPRRSAPWACASRRRTRSSRRCARPSPAAGRRSSTSGPPPRRTCTPWSRPARRSPR